MAVGLKVTTLTGSSKVRETSPESRSSANIVNSGDTESLLNTRVRMASAMMIGLSDMSNMVIFSSAM